MASPHSDTPWRNRIVRQGMLPVDDVLFNPFNWRIHPRGQQESLGDVLEQVGWVQQVIVNETTGHLVDGHLRVLLAERHNEGTVPAIWVSLSEEEEKLVLASLDPIGAMAVADQEKLDELLKDLSQAEDEVLSEVAHQAAEAANTAPIATAETQFQRPDFTGLVEKLAETAVGQSKKDGSWFYVEYYGQDELFTMLQERLREAGVLTGDHRLEPSWFAEKVMG